MINWMRNAFLKLSTTYQLRTQVEQWYDADGTYYCTRICAVLRSGSYARASAVFRT